MSVLHAAFTEVVTTNAVDACTLNNAMNACQIALLVALVRWTSRGGASR